MMFVLGAQRRRADPLGALEAGLRKLILEREVEVLGACLGEHVEARMLRSSDGGQTFSAPFTVHQDRQVITHRFESIAFDASGALHVLWIDKRDVEAMRVARPQGASKGGGHTDYRGAAVYRVVSVDGGRSFSPDTRLFDHSCECCRIALAPTPEGGLAALWRHVFDPNERDHAFTRLTPGAMAAQTA